MTADPKYITFKFENFKFFVENYVSESISPEAIEAAIMKMQVEDAVVIRKQDVFASAALYTYANSIEVAAKVLRESDPGTSSQLQRIADHFAHEAQDASIHSWDLKLPD